MVDVEYLTVDQVVALHVEALTYGGIEGLRSEHLLSSAVMQPQQSVFGEDAYPTIAEKAAAYGYFITENHPFIDGNKRTAAFAMLAFLDANGYELREENAAIEQMFVDLASKVIGQSEFFGWVCNHIGPRQAEIVPFEKGTE
jgi:death on curing protein